MPYICMNGSTSQPITGEPNPNSFMNEQSNKKNSNKKTIVIALAVISIVTFVIVVLEIALASARYYYILVT